MTTTPTTINPDRLAYDAMQEAIAYIQKQLGIAAGDFAGAYFSDDGRETPILEIFVDYARNEMRNLTAESTATTRGKGLGMTEASFIGDEWHCRCGNQPHTDGFYPCLKSGEYVEPTPKTWPDGDLYRCTRCDAIIQFNVLTDVGTIVGQTEARFLEMDQP